MYCQITKHLETHHPLYQVLNGDFSQESQQSLRCCNNSQLMDAGKEIRVVLLDLRKVFDSVRHQVLLDTELNEFILKWICDYLTQRKCSN